MDDIILKAAELLRAINIKEKEIDNPVLTLSVKSELLNFIEYLKEEEKEKAEL